jgi:TusA-related sulfurtransferase
MTEQRLDCLGESCPVPLIKAKKKLSNMKSGEVLIIEVDHTCAMSNIPEWAEKEGYQVHIKEVDFGLWEIYLIKTK